MQEKLLRALAEPSSVSPMAPQYDSLARRQLAEWCGADRGRQAALCRYAQISPAYLSHVLAGTRRIHADVAVRIEEITLIKVKNWAK